MSGMLLAAEKKIKISMSARVRGGTYSLRLFPMIHTRFQNLRSQTAPAVEKIIFFGEDKFYNVTLHQALETHMKVMLNE